MNHKICSECQAAVALEIELLLHKIEQRRKDYLIYRGSSFSQITGELLWAKDDALGYSEGMDDALAIIRRVKDRLSAQE